MSDHPALLPGEEFEIDLKGLARKILRGWVLLLAGGALGCLLAVAYGFWKGPSYDARMRVLETNTASMSALAGLGSLKSLVGAGGDDELGSLELFKALLGSRAVVERVVRRRVVDPRTDSVRTVYRVLGMDPLDPWKWDKVAEGLTKAVEVVPVGGGVFELSTQAGSSWQAKTILDLFYEEGMAELRNASRERFTTTIQSLGNAVEVASRERRKAVAELAYFRARNISVVSPALFMQQSRLEVEAKIKEQKYLASRQELEAVLLQREKFSLPAIVISPAVRPVRPFKPSWPKLVVAGLFGGMVVGAGFALRRG